MTDFSATASALATIAAALVGGGVTFLVAVFTKENKVSDFRQTWIDGLRDDTAKFIGIWYYAAAELDLVSPEDYSSREFWRSMKDEFLEMEILQARIVLRLNPTEHGDVMGSTPILRTLSLSPILGQRSVHVQAQALQP